LLGGASARPALLARARERGVPVLTTYGLTEACSQVTTQLYGTANLGDLGAGSPLAGIEVRIGEGGAIQVRGPTLLSGYFTRSERAALDADGWFHTDDIGRFDANGNLHVLGRRTECVITGGENVYPAEVETILESCPAVGRACVFGVPDDVWGETLAVAIVAANEQDARQIVEFARSRLAPHRRPRHMVFVDGFVTSESGKLDRHGTASSVRERLRPINY
jgi:O-succinylbenzoic acid--CoA ligase